MEAMNKSDDSILTALWKARPWPLNGNHILDMSADLVQVVLGWPLLPTAVRMILEPQHVDGEHDSCPIDLTSDDDNDDLTPDAGEVVAPTVPQTMSFAMQKVCGTGVDIAELAHLCKTIFTGGRDWERELRVVWGGWAYRMVVKRSAGTTVFSVLSGDKGACTQCLRLDVMRDGGGVINSNLQYVNYCFDGDDDRCFDSNTTKGRAKVIMRMVDLLNQLCNVTYCRSQDSQQFGDDFYLGSMYTVLKKDTTFYEPFGFITAPEPGVSPPLLLGDMDELSRTHTAMKAMFRTLMGMKPPDVIKTLQSGAALEASRKRVHEDVPQLYRLLIPARASKTIPIGTWYLTGGVGVPALAVQNLEMKIDATIFEVTQATTTLTALREVFGNDDVFALADGVKAPMTLLRCHNVASGSNRRMAVVMERWATEWGPSLKELGTEDLTLNDIVRSSPQNVYIDDILTSAFSSPGIIKYYRAAGGRVVRGTTNYQPTVFDTCHSIANAIRSTRRRK